MHRFALVALVFLPAIAGADAPPGTTIAHSPAKSKQYIGSPSIAVLPNGDYVASHDLFMAGDNGDRTHVYGTSDQGKTWSHRAEIVGQWWSTLFVHKGILYLMGVSKARGYCIIRKSTDGGKTWTEPKDAKTGLLHADGMYHCAPVPVLAQGGRLWRAMEEANPTNGGKGWDRKFRSMMLSAPVDADLLDAKSWTTTNKLAADYSWFDGKFGGWLEGNAVATPAGAIVNILRVQQPNYPEKAAMVRISADGRTASFDAAKDFIDFPGGGKKFTIRYDEKSKKYWTLANFVPKEFEGPNAASRRNTLALASSADLRTWEVKRTVIQHKDVKSNGYQYADWLFDGDDLIAVVRTASDEPDGHAAHNAHDANYLTFHRVAGFRK
jgi:hypothetical protein